MKKSLLFASALAVAASAYAAPGLVKADPSAFKMGPQAPTTQSMQKAPTRAEDALETFDFSYADYPYSALSMDGVTAGVSRVYMCFQMAPEDIKTFAGSKVTGFSVYSPTDYYSKSNTIREAEFFYSTDPKLASADYTQTFSLSQTPYALNKANVDEPYTITGEEEALFFGYSVVVPKANNMYYIVFDYVPTTPSALICGISQDGTTFPSQFNVGGDYYGALCMSVMLEGKNFPKTISFEQVPSQICIQKGRKDSVPITIKASCGSPISSFDIEFNLGGKPYTSSYSYSTPIPAGSNRYMGALLEFPVQNDTFMEEVEFKISSLNGEPYVGVGATAKATVAVVEKAPVHQTLIEEYTSTACQFCTRGYAALEYIRKNYPEFIAVSYHTQLSGSADPMQVTTDFPMPSLSESLPSASLNRQMQVDPHDGSYQYGESLLVPIIGDVEDQNSVPTPWNVDVSHTWTSDNELTVKAEVANMCGYTGGGFSLAYILVADGLTGKTSGWVQQNYYYNTAPQFCEEMNAFCKGGEYGRQRVAGLVFNDVVVSQVGINGVAGSLPESLEAEKRAEHSITFDLSKIKTGLDIDKNKLRVVAAVLDEYGQVLNAAKDEVNDYIDTGVAGVADENAPVEYFNLNGMKVSNPSEGVFIRRQGTKTEKVLVR